MVVNLIGLLLVIFSIPESSLCPPLSPQSPPFAEEKTSSENF